VTRSLNPDGLAALLEVAPGRETSAMTALRELPRGERSPLGRVERTHLARLMLVRSLPNRRRKPTGGPWLLFFAAEFDGPLAGYLEALCIVLSADADRIFCHCVGYPGVQNPPAFKKWVLRHRVPPGFSIHGNPGATVGEVRESVALRQRLVDFAVETRKLRPAELHRRWMDEDWGAPAPAAARPAAQPEPPDA
jgi:hypothetical protein